MNALKNNLVHLKLRNDFTSSFCNLRSFFMFQNTMTYSTIARLLISYNLDCEVIFCLKYWLTKQIMFHIPQCSMHQNYLVQIQGTENTIVSTLFCSYKFEQIICFLEDWVK
jgi:hypothetical protein